MNELYKKLDNLYFKEKIGFLKIINSDGQMHLLNKLKGEVKNKNSIRENIFSELLEERVSNVEKSRIAKFDNNKKTYYQIALIFESVFYLAKSHNDKRYKSFFEESYNRYLNTFEEKAPKKKTSNFEPNVDDFL